MDSHESHRMFDAIRLPVKPLFTGAAAVAFKSRRQKARLDISRKQRLGDRRKEYTWSPVGIQPNHKQRELDVRHVDPYRPEQSRGFAALRSQ